MNKFSFDFSSSPTIAKFLQDGSYVRGLMGPVGSGKSYACCSEILKRAIQQKPSPRDGIKYSRFAIVRNTHPMLRTTTLKTWLEVVPENVYGPVKYAPPITHHIKLPSREGAAGIDAEIIFLALDDQKDVRKLLSLELTGAWVNEARELPVAVINGLSHRVGRFPSKADGGPTWRGIILDTNPMDDDHWYYRLAEKDRPTGRFAWKFFKQPGGVLPVPVDELPDDMPEAQGYIFQAGKWWKTNPNAENLHNLVDGYYDQILGGKNADWIKCYAQGQYTYVQEGKPVWSEYDDNLMAEDLEIKPNLPVIVGLDFGLTPAATFAQRLPNGRWHVLHELVTFDMGLNRFVTSLKSMLDQYYSGHEVITYGDPAGMARDQIFESTAFDHLKQHGILARPTHTNDFRTRREAMAMPMGRLIEGRPGFLINKSCIRLRKALAGGYHFKRVQIGTGGTERYKDTPNKNEHSHIADSAAYLFLGGGEHKGMTRRPMSKIQQPLKGAFDFNVFS